LETISLKSIVPIKRLPAHPEDSAETMPFTLRTRRERAHLNLSSPRLLAKAHGHGVPGYPEEVGQRHRFPLQQRDMNHDESQQTTGI